MNMLSVIKSVGLHTVQDLGRTGYRSMGVPTSGVMDEWAFRIANMLVQNESHVAGYELSSGLVIFTSNQKILLAVTGLAEISIDTVKIPAWRPFILQANELLTIKCLGNFSYLAVHGGIKVKKWLGSASTYLPVKNLTPLSQGSHYEIAESNLYFIESFPFSKKNPAKKYSDWTISSEFLTSYKKETLRIIAGRELNQFTSSSIANFIIKKYLIGNEKNRMALVVHQSPLVALNSSNPMLSVAVQKGTIQQSPDGTLYILMADAQTTGGYPRIGQVILADIPILSQMPVNKPFQFEWVELTKAMKLYEEKLKLLEALRQSIAQRYLT